MAVLINNKSTGQTILFFNDRFQLLYDEDFRKLCRERSLNMMIHITRKLAKVSNPTDINAIKSIVCIKEICLVSVRDRINGSGQSRYHGKILFTNDIYTLVQYKKEFIVITDKPITCDRTTFINVTEMEAKQLMYKNMNEKTTKKMIYLYA